MKNMLGSIAAAALLAGSMGIAGAQSTSPNTPGAAEQSQQNMQGKCWDEAMNMVRDKNASGSGTMGAGTGSTGSTAGAGGLSGTGETTGSAQTGNTGSASTSADTTGQGTAQGKERPAHARGLPEC